MPQLGPVFSARGTRTHTAWHKRSSVGVPLATSVACLWLLIGSAEGAWPLRTIDMPMTGSQAACGFPSWLLEVPTGLDTGFELRIGPTGIPLGVAGP
jgi:hypothetical protein